MFGIIERILNSNDVDTEALSTDPWYSATSSSDNELVIYFGMI